MRSGTAMTALALLAEPMVATPCAAQIDIDPPGILTCAGEPAKIVGWPPMTPTSARLHHSEPPGSHSAAA